MLLAFVQPGLSNSSSPGRYSSLSLKDVVCLCADSRDDAAWQEFISRVGRAIALTIIRTASMWGEASRTVVEDLSQITYAKLWEDRCRMLRDFAVEHPEAILGYLKRVAANATHDYFRHVHSQTSGGSQPHVSADEVDPEAGKEVLGSRERLDFEIFLNQIDQHLQHCLSEPDGERDRMVFWLYFRQGMSTKEIASIPTIGLTEKGVGSVIERLKRALRARISAEDPKIY